MQAFQREYTLHTTFLSRWYASSESWFFKVCKLVFYLEFLLPSRYLTANVWVPYLAAPVTVLYLLILKIPDAPTWMFFFILYHWMLMIEGSVLCIILYFFPSLKKHLDSFVYGSDMTYGFLGNPNSNTLRSLAVVALSAASTTGIWYGEGVAATSEVAGQLKTYKDIYGEVTPISFDQFQSKVLEATRSYPLHAASDLVEVSIKMKKTGNAGFAASGIQK